MTDIRKETIIRISQEILDYLLKYRETHPGFTFSPRERDSVQSEDKRLEAGFWFQGSDYIYVPLFKKGDTARKIKTLGFVISLNPRGEIIRNGIQISFKKGLNAPAEFDFHRELAKELNVDLNKSNFGFKAYNNPEKYIENLDDYLNVVYPKAISLLNKYGLLNDYALSEVDFKKRIDKISAIQQTRKSSGLTSINVKATMQKNQILYGPPGTGKTYTTINRALEIVDPEFYAKNNNDRKKLTERFKELLIKNWTEPSGRIAFVTFHQSTSYEDFIEGIKPDVIEIENGNKEGITYEVKDGIFKLIAQKASWRKGNFDKVFADFLESINETKERLPLTITSKYTTFDVIFRETTVLYVKPKSSKKENAWYPVSIVNIRKVYETGSYEGVYNPTYVREILQYLKKVKGLIEPKENNTEIPEPHVLIIDEINRGNIAEIFGDLITLLEPDKRKGQKEELELILPYSKKTFSVPDNLYIVGTMNTADRSVEALDTALRRRFVFEEMAPESSLLKPEQMLWQFWWDNEKYSWDDQEYRALEIPFYQLLGFPDDKNNEKDKEVYWEPMRKANTPLESQIDTLTDLVKQFSGINLWLLLDAINIRIEKLLGRDYMIGHAYFINVLSIADLKAIFFNKILPLLQEYFYRDYGRIGLVIGMDFLDETTKSSINLMKVKGYDVHDLNEGKIYHLKSIRDFDNDITFIAAVKKIYGS